MKKRLIAEQYTIGAGPGDLTARSAGLYHLGGNRYRLVQSEGVNWEEKKNLTEEQAIAWLTYHVLTDRNAGMAFDRSLRTLFHDLPARIATSIAEAEAIEDGEERFFLVETLAASLDFLG
jgi:hypothetical protein